MEALNNISRSRESVLVGAIGRVFVRLKMAKDSREKTPLINRKFKDSEEELTACGATVCYAPRRSFHRYFVLGLICFLNFGKLILSVTSVHKFQFTSR